MEDIEKFRMSKPEWATDPETLDFKVINNPLMNLGEKLTNTLERRAREHFTEFNFLTEKIVAGCFQTYQSVRKLVAKDPKYPTQAHILSRSILDSLFVIEAFSEDPEQYPRAYALAGYRMTWEEYNKEYQEYGENPDWTGYLTDKRELLEFSARTYDLSEDERNSPEGNIPYWPIPSKMLRDRIFSGERHLFLEELYKWHYGWESALSHFQWMGMSASVFSSSPEHHWHPGKFESDAVYKSALYLTMIISEIEAVSAIGIKSQLKYIWTILGSYWEEAEKFYDTRFSTLLALEAV
jgi:hypothetical protein